MVPQDCRGSYTFHLPRSSLFALWQSHTARPWGNVILPPTQWHFIFEWCIAFLHRHWANHDSRLNNARPSVMCEIQYMQKNPGKLRIYRQRIHACIKSARFGIFQTRRPQISLLLSTDVLEIRLCLNPLAGHSVIKMHCCLQVGNFTILHIEPNMELDCLDVYGQAMIPHALDLHFFF